MLSSDNSRVTPCVLAESVCFSWRAQNELTTRAISWEVKGCERFSQVQKTSFPHSTPAQQQQAMDRQASAGAPPGPVTPRPSPQTQTNAHSRELRNDGSFDLGSFLAN